MFFPQLKITDLGDRGLGVITETLIPKHAEVLEFQGQKVFSKMIEDFTHCLQIDSQTFLAESGELDDFINHSCLPSCGIRLTNDQRVILFAFEEIHPGTEITFDYATTQSGDHEILDCLCQQSICRKKIGSFDELPVDLKLRYKNLGAVLPYLLSDIL